MRFDATDHAHLEPRLGACGVVVNGQTTEHSDVRGVGVDVCGRERSAQRT